MSLLHPSLHPSTERARSLDLDCTRAGTPTGQSASPLGGPPAPADIFLEMGIAVAAALGLAVVLGLTV
jgi:hypothetical protein